jgi:DNA-binding NtrC family response regulator
VDHFIRRLNIKLNRQVRAADPQALHVLVSHGWRGNVRELENVLERAMILGDGDFVGVRHLSQDIAVGAPAPSPANQRDAVRGFERQHILEVLTQAQFDKREAARLLGISLASLYRKLNVESDDDPESEET